MDAKIQIKNDLAYIFGGFFFFIDHIRKSGLAKVIDNALGFRSSMARYSYSEFFGSLMATYLTRGSRIEDAKRLSAQFSEKPQGYGLCSPDTILKMLLDKAAEDTLVESEDGNRYKFSINGSLSGLLMDGLPEYGQVDRRAKHTFGYDSQFIPTGKQDFRYASKTKLQVHIAEAPLRAVARGTGIALKNFPKFSFLIR